MKKVLFSTFAAGLAAASLSAHAALPTEALPFQTVIPNLKGGALVTLEGLFLQPSNSDLQSSRVDTTQNNFKYTSVKPEYNFGFRAGLGYVIPNSGNDVQVSWTHFDHNTDDPFSYTPRNEPNAIVTDGGQTSFKYDAVDLDIGQYMSIGTRLQSRLFVGVRAIQLENDFSITNTKVTTSAPQPALLRDSESNAKFTGIGPRAGLDATYYLGNGFGVATHLAGALLVGTVETDAFSQEGSGRQYYADADKKTRVVPAYDWKLGANYTFPFKNNSSSMTLEAGYQVTQYIDVIDRTLTNVHGGGAKATTVTTSSIGFQGPYLSLNFKI